MRWNAQVSDQPFQYSLILQLEHFDMSFKLLFILFLLVVNGQHLLFKVPDACSVPKTPPACVYSTATPYFNSCGIYTGDDCPRFCHAIQAQYWAGQSSRGRCFEVTPSLVGLKSIYAFCMDRCDDAKKRISQYRIDGLSQVAHNDSWSDWNASNIKALIYLSVNRTEYVTSRVLVYTSNLLHSCSRDKNGTYSCSRATYAPYNHCSCSSCTKHRANCSKCCKNKGIIWV